MGDFHMKTISCFSKIALTAALGLGMAIPVVAATNEQVQTPIPSTQLVAARRCVYKRIYHPGHYTRRFGLVGKRVYHPGYYTTKRVC